MMMVIWLFVAFVVVPVLEIWLITQVADQLGWIPALALVIGVSVAGAWLVRREGLGVIQRLRDTLRSGRMPTNDLADGAMIFFASALMLTPGFLTDGIGLALLIPPIRAILRPPVIAFFRRRLDVRIAGISSSTGWQFDPSGRPPRTQYGDVVDIDDDSIRQRDDEPPPADGPELGSGQ
jgi:UPF0716 protein FxsA